MLAEYILGAVMLAFMLPMAVYLHVATRSPQVRVPAVRVEPSTVNLTLNRDGVYR